MSTPRQKWKRQESCSQCNGDGCAMCECQVHPLMELPCRLCEHEGVAAPLEPTTEKFLLDYCKSTSMTLNFGEIVEVMNLYAAAVSKNLQEELAETKAILRQWENASYGVGEIAALPKNGRWNAALDKAAEMLSRMEVIAGQPRATVEKAVVEIRKLKEITALRETK